MKNSIFCNLFFLKALGIILDPETNFCTVFISNYSFLSHFSDLNEKFFAVSMVASVVYASFLLETEGDNSFF